MTAWTCVGMRGWRLRLLNRGRYEEGLDYQVNPPNEFKGIWLVRGALEVASATYQSLAKLLFTRG